MTQYPLDPAHLDKSIFRAYDIRGEVGNTLTEAVAYHLGLSFGSEAIAQNQHQVVIARDGRLSSPTLSESLSAGLCRAGLEVIDIGLVPTPVLYFACEAYHTQTGIMITGSHNPINYNGFKLVLNGTTLAETAIQKLYERILRQEYILGQGSVQQKDIRKIYIESVCARVQLKKPMKVVVDCGNGAVGVIAQEFFNALGVEYIGLYSDVDGTFPNHHPDPGQPNNLKDLREAVQAHHADLGFAFDGDGDRLGIVTHEGEIIWPDRILMLFAQEVLKHEPNSSIIFDVKCSVHVGRMVEKFGGIPVLYKSGHSLIKKQMKALNAPLAGEMSGHFFFKHRWFGFDDACFAAAFLLEILTEDPLGRNLAQLAEGLPTGLSTPEIIVPLADDLKFDFLEKLKQCHGFKDALIITIDGLRAEFKKGWGLVRASNTAPNLVLRFEAETQQDLDEIKQAFKRAMLLAEPSLKCAF